MVCDFQFVQVNYGDGVVAGQGYVGARAVRDDQDSAGAAADVKHLINGARGGVHDDEFAGFRVGNERELAVRREFQAIGMFGARVYRLDYFAGGGFDNRNGAIAGIGGPDFLVVR